MTCGKLYPNNEANNEVYLVTFPTWRTTRRCRAAEVVAGTASAKVAAGAGQEMASDQQKWLLAPHQWKLLLMHILPKQSRPSRQMAAGCPITVQHLSDPEAYPAEYSRRRSQQK